MLWQLVKLWWVQKISPRKIKESVLNVITILMTDYGIWKESRPSVLFAHKKTRQFIDIQQKTSFVFVPVTSSQIFLSPTTTYASSKDKKKQKIIHQLCLILWIVALVIWISQYCVSNTIEELIKKIKIIFTFDEVIKV